MLIAHINAVEDHLLVVSQIPANSGHSLHKGTPREAFIREFLEKHLNSHVAIGTGEIIDSRSRPGDSRNQFDLVIYKRHYPRLEFGAGISGFLAESVIATIEVKSLLDKSGIEQAIGAAKAAKNLEKSEVKSISAGYIPPSILSYVVAYDGPAKMETVYGWIKEAYAAKNLREPDITPDADRSQVSSPALDGVFLLGKGFLNFDNSPFGFISDDVCKRNPGVHWTIANVERGSLLSLFMQLTVATSNLDGSWLNPLPYLAAFRLFDIHYAN